MNNKIKFIYLVIMFGMFCFAPSISTGAENKNDPIKNSAESNKEDVTIYLNAGTEKYIQGNFQSAVDDLEKARKLDPENKKTKELLVKILVEATSQNHIKHNYQAAMKYIQKASEIDPNNPRVVELYSLTKELLFPKKEQEKNGSSENIKPARAEKTAEPKRQEVSRVDNEPQKTVVNTVYRDISRPAVKIEEKKYMFSLAKGLMILLSLCLAGALVAVYMLWKELRIKTKVARDAEAEKNLVFIELEKSKERYKYEHLALEQSKNELEQLKRTERERMKMELDLKMKQVEEKVQSQMLGKTSAKGDQQEAFLHQQQAKVLEVIGDSSQIQDSSSLTLEAMRERIAIMALNLYEYSPEAASKFLINMIQNSNPLVRMNVVRALATIAKKETLQMMIALYEDKDSRVKREVIRNMKKVIEKVASSEIIIDEAEEDKLRAILSEEKTKGEWIF